MVPTDEAMITRQMLYSPVLTIGATFVIFFSLIGSICSGRVESLRRFAPQQVVEIADLVAEGVELAGQSLNVGSGAAVDIEIEFAAQAIFEVLAVLAHHDNRSLNGGEHGKEQVEQDVRIRIPGGLAHQS